MPHDRRDVEIHGVAAIAEARKRLLSVVGKPVELVLGWATLELDRAAYEVARTIGSGHEPVLRPAPDDDLLGAWTRLLEFEPGLTLVLLEPKTEGRIAASLVRFGEGPVAEYVIAHDELEHVASRLQAAGLSLSAEANGPFGRQRLVAPGRAWGAHLVLAARQRQPARPA